MDSFSPYKPIPSKIPFLNEKYQVFLSFNGEDVSKTFVDHMFESLNAIGICVHNSKLKQAIENSDIIIPIFSRNYAGSSWCLQEVTHMWKSKALIIPLFYHVHPSQFRIAEALKEQCSTESMEWKQALHQVSSLPGWRLDSRSCLEGELVKRIVSDIINTVEKIPLQYVAKHPVQLDNKIQEIIRLLKLDDQAAVLTIGIWGMGGCGKTTIAKAVFNHIFQSFNSYSFLSDVRNMSHKQFQEQIIRDKIKRSDEDCSMIAQVSVLKRSLVVLDDIDDSKQMELLRWENWGSRGSRMIVTTRDKHVLNMAQIDTVYKMEGLEYEEALSLFSWHAFLRPEPNKMYKKQSKRIVEACFGLPLAIEAAGDLLHDKKESLHCWREALSTPQSICHRKIYDVLKISYDNLSYQEKKIFVDIACIFRGKETKQGIRHWKRFNWDAHTAIANLVLKSLIIIGDDDVFMMHDLLSDMGKAIRKADDTSSFSFICLPVFIPLTKSHRKFGTNKRLEKTMEGESTLPGVRNVQDAKQLVVAADFLSKTGFRPNFVLNLL